jgi:flagellar L-ring protein precursor FlgH
MPALSRIAALCLGTGWLAGCSLLYPRVEIDDAPPARSAPVAAAASGDGSIFQGATYRPLFEDYRARLVGDTLVVNIVEKVSASQVSTSSIDKTGSLAGTFTAVPGLKAPVLSRLAADASTANSFAGKGSTANTNDFSGTITVVVRQVLPNGNLLVSGEKQIGVNSNVDVLRFSGQVDPRFIQPGNTVQSAQIANVRLEQHGKGAQADAQASGWLSRVFYSLMPI